jgi:hypothetical protein
LVAVGDDSDLAWLRSERGQSERSPAYRLWLEYLAEALAKRWQDETRRWPDEPVDWVDRGRFLSGQDGRLLVDGRSFEGVRYRVFQFEGEWTQTRLEVRGTLIIPFGAPPMLPQGSRLRTPYGTYDLTATGVNIASNAPSVATFLARPAEDEHA